MYLKYEEIDCLKDSEKIHKKIKEAVAVFEKQGFTIKDKSCPAFRGTSIQIFLWMQIRLQDT